MSADAIKGELEQFRTDFLPPLERSTMRHGRYWRALSLMILFGWAVFSIAQAPKKPVDPPPIAVKV